MDLRASGGRSLPRRRGGRAVHRLAAGRTADAIRRVGRTPRPALAAGQLLLLLAIVAAASASSCSRRGESPNVVLITVDTLRPDHLGCYGYARGTSPAIDRLAAEGTGWLRQVPVRGARRGTHVAAEVLDLPQRAAATAPLAGTGHVRHEVPLHGAPGEADLDLLDLVGWVEDLTDEFGAARAFLAPLRYGAGTKGKITTALARGVPTVTTPIGAEGMAGNVEIGRAHV